MAVQKCDEQELIHTQSTNCQLRGWHSGTLCVAVSAQWDILGEGGDVFAQWDIKGEGVNGAGSASFINLITHFDLFRNCVC